MADEVKTYRPGDIGAGELFEDFYAGQVKYCSMQGVWFIWDGFRWKEDATEYIYELAKTLVAVEMPKLAGAIAGDDERRRWLDWVKKMQSNYSRNQMLMSARSRPSIAAEVKEFDWNPQLVNMKNGILDINNGTLMPHNKAFMMTKLSGAHYDPSATGERWGRFVVEVMGGNEDAARFLQKAVGYSLAGNPLDDCLFVLYGEKTRNGKTTFCRAILHALGDYGSTARPETLAVNRMRTGSGPNSDVARLRGARFVNMPEPGKGMELDGALVKSLTGRDPMLARFMHKDFFEFVPQFVLFLNTNYLPRIDDMTLFSSGRIFCIPFPVHFGPDKQDVGLLDQFVAPEATSAIFNWIFEGYQMYRQEGLKSNIPDVVRAATKDYSDNSDTFGRFLHEAIAPCENNWIGTMDIYRVYEEWAKGNGHHPMSSKTLSMEMRQRGYKPRQHPRTRRNGFNDIVLIQDVPEGW